MNKVSKLLIKLIIGLAVVLGIWYVVKCQCINLMSLTPASIRDYIQSFGSLAALVYILAYILNTISVIPPIAPLSLKSASNGLLSGRCSGIRDN